MLYELLILLFSYFCGSIPVGYLIGKFFYGIDIRKHGSGNIGAANAFRLLGKKAGIATMVGDMLKGTFGTLVTRFYLWYGNYDGFGTYQNSNITLDSGFLLALSALMAIIGHSYPIWLKFKGGKSASVGAGALLGINPIAFVVCFSTWVIILIITRYTSLSNLITALVIPPLYWYFAGDKFFNNRSLWALYISFAVIVFIYWRHRENIKRLLEGNERKFGQKEDIK